MWAESWAVILCWITQIYVEKWIEQKKRPSNTTTAQKQKPEQHFWWFQITVNVTNTHIKETTFCMKINEENNRNRWKIHTKHTMPIRIHIMLTRSLLVGNRVWKQSFLWCPEWRLRTEKCRKWFILIFNKLIFNRSHLMKYIFQRNFFSKEKKHQVSSIEFSVCWSGPMSDVLQTHSEDEEMNRSRNKGECWTIVKWSRCNQSSVFISFAVIQSSFTCEITRITNQYLMHHHAGDERSFYASQYFRVNIFFFRTLCGFIRIIWKRFWLICSFIFEMIR